MTSPTGLVALERVVVVEMERTPSGRTVVLGDVELGLLGDGLQRGLVGRLKIHER